MNILEQILEATKAANQALKKKLPASVLHVPSDVTGLFLEQRATQMAVVMEIKRKSPSAGWISRSTSVPERAMAYEQAGASMISVLCDEEFFGGSFEHLAQVREVSKTPMLCKGFTIDPIQVEAASRVGADAVLLIARILSDEQLASLLNAIRSLGMTPIVEVVTEQELERALALDVKIIGVNARDLASLKMDVERAERVLRLVPPDRIALHFSGVSKIDAIARLRDRPATARAVDGMLIGEWLMKQAHPLQLARSIVTEARRPIHKID
jgi:indole-3-glycerol phosphate synthase